MKDSNASDSAELGSSCLVIMRLLPQDSDFGCTPVLCCLPQDLKGSWEVSQRKWQSQRAHQSINLYEFDSYIFMHSNESAGKTIVEPEGETEKNKLTIYVRTSSGKTISIKCDKKRKAVSLLDEVERRSPIPRGMTSRASWKRVERKKEQ